MHLEMSWLRWDRIMDFNECSKGRSFAFFPGHDIFTQSTRLDRLGVAETHSLCAEQVLQKLGCRVLCILSHEVRRLWRWATLAGVGCWLLATFAATYGVVVWICRSSRAAAVACCCCSDTAVRIKRRAVLSTLRWSIQPDLERQYSGCFAMKSLDESQLGEEIKNETISQ